MRYKVSEKERVERKAGYFVFKVFLIPQIDGSGASGLYVEEDDFNRLQIGQEITVDLAWLDSGNIGTHYKAIP